MPTDTATFRLSLEDNISGATAAMVSPLEKLKAQLEGDTTELNAMEKALRQMKQASVMDVAATRSLTAQISAQKDKVALGNVAIVKQGAAFKSVAKDSSTAGSAMKKLGESVGKVDNPVKNASKGFRALSQVTKGMGGDFGGPLKKMAMLTKGMAALGPAGMASVVVLGAAVIAGGLAALVGTLAAYAIHVVDADAKQQMLFEGMTGSASGGEALKAVIDDVAGSVPIASAKVADLAQNLYKSGLRGDKLKTELIGASMEAAGLGKKTKVGSDLAMRAMLPMSVQAEKFHEKIAGLFKGVAVVPFEQALQRVIGMFDESTVTGQALKTMIEGMLNPLFGDSGLAGASLEEMFEKITLYALKADLAVLKFVDSIEMWNAQTPDTSWIGVASAASWLFNIALTGVGATIVSVLDVFSGLGRVVAWASGLFGSCSAAIHGGDCAGPG